MALTKVTGQVIKNTTDVTVGVLTVTNTLAVGGTVSIGGTLTYEDVTNVDAVGLITARNGIVVGSGITLSKDGDIFATGVTTSTTFVGNVTGDVTGAATQVTLAAQSSDTDCFPVFSLTATGNQALFTKSNRLSFNSVTGALSATSFVGDGSNLTGIDTDLVSDTSPQLGGNLDVNTKNILFGDSGSASDDRLQFGASQDLNIFHDGSNSYVRETGTGDLYIECDSKIYIGKASGGAENGVVYNVDGSVDLYHNNTKKFATHSSGVFVSQDANIGRLILGDTSGNYAYQLTGYDAAASATGGRMVVQDADGGTVIDSRVSGGDMFLYNTVKLNGNGTADNLKLVLGAGNDLQIYHDGSNSYLKNAGTGNIIFLSDDVQFKSDGGGNTGLTINTDGAVELYHNNTKRLETESAGIKSRGTLKFTSEDQNVTHNKNLYYLVVGTNSTSTITLTSLNGTGLIRIGGYANAGQGALALHIIFGGAMFATQHYQATELQNSAMQNTSISLSKNSTNYTIAISNTSGSYTLNLSVYLESTGGAMGYAVS